MTGSPPELKSFLEAEMFFGVKKRERIAYAVAGGGLAIGLMGMIVNRHSNGPPDRRPKVTPLAGG